jgi:hypothetical protein
MAIPLNKWLILPLFSPFLFNTNDNRQPAVPEAVHPIHIATVEIEHNATEKTLEITCKTFWDDFENILSKINKTRVDLTSDKATDENGKKIFSYINSHLSISIDGKLMPLSFVGYEKEDVVVYSYLQADNVTTVKNVSIVNTLMHDMFDDQVEIIHMIVNGNRKSTKLDYPAKSAEFVF